jgi:hypothetical protein
MLAVFQITDKETSRIRHELHSVLALLESLIWSQWLYYLENYSSQTPIAYSDVLHFIFPLFEILCEIEQDMHIVTTIDPMDCYKMHACDTQSNYPPDCVCNTDSYF